MGIEPLSSSHYPVTGSYPGDEVYHKTFSTTINFINSILSQWLTQIRYGLINIAAQWESGTGRVCGAPGRNFIMCCYPVLTHAILQKFFNQSLLLTAFVGSAKTVKCNI
jgi:hypothetical protein